jgi:hypothetical protein
MPRSCSVCASPDLAALSKAIAAGGSNRDVANRFGVSVSSVQRHRISCLQSPRKEKDTGTSAQSTSSPGSVRFDSGDPKSLISTTARLVDEALGLLEHAKTAGDHKTALQALREARDGLALLMRTAGMLAGDGGSTTIDNRRQIVQVLGKLTESELRALASGKPIESLESEASVSIHSVAVLGEPNT